MIKYFAVAGECERGNLVPVLPEWRSPAVPVNLLYPRRRFVSRKFQTFCAEFYERRAQHYEPSYRVEVVSFPKFQT